MSSCKMNTPFLEKSVGQKRDRCEFHILTRLRFPSGTRLATSRKSSGSRSGRLNFLVVDNYERLFALPPSPFERSRFAADAFACLVPAAVV
jgi:hypothetical protein